MPYIKLLPLIKDAEKNFPAIDIATRRYEAESLISQVLNISRIDIYIQDEHSISETEQDSIQQMFNRRKNNEPLQYILERTQFRDLDIKVGSGVLIPRPETEQIIDIVKSLNLNSPNVIDIGTGTGVIALSIAKEIKNSQVIGIDISQKALDYAFKNKEINNIKNVKFFINDLCSGFDADKFNLIISNPPYVTEEEYNNLTPDVHDFEPKLALESGRDGLDSINKLILQAYKTLKTDGYLLFEMGYLQGESARVL